LETLGANDCNKLIADFALAGIFPRFLQILGCVAVEAKVR